MSFSNSKKNITTFSILLLFFLSFVSTPGTAAEDKFTPPEQRLKSYRQHMEMEETSMFKHLPWQFLGPLNISGRMTDTAVVAPKGKNYTIYVAGASGGVWKTTNEGTTWEPIFEHAPSTSIGDIAIAPSNQDIIWIGTGEANIFRSSQAGAGVYKSTDAGKTWEHMGLTDTNTIPRILIHPQNSDIVFVAASGHEWTNNTDRGIYKTTDGGKTWKKIFYIDEKTGAIDLVMNPTDPNILYTSTWQRIRKKWNDPRNEPGCTGSSIYKSVDGGNKWEPIDNGLPTAQFRGRIGIDICRSKPNVLYAFIDNYEIAKKWEEGETDSYGRPRGDRIKGATVYRSDDSGKTWREVSTSNDYMLDISATYGWVFGQIRVDPVNENKIYVMGVELHVSDDSGKTFRTLDGMHGDHHGLWIDPDNPNYLVNTNDGGLAISYDGGKNWRTFSENLPLVQFFNVSYDMDTPFHVYGSIQDHGSYRGIVDLSKGRFNIPAMEWERAPGGEGSSHAIDPTDSNIVYSAGFYGNITRSDLGKNETKLVVPKAEKGEPPLRGQWLAPFIISPHNPRIIYLGLNFLFRSMNRGESWEKLSPDLSYNEKNKIGDIQYQTIFSISESPLKFGLIYAGTDDGRAHVTKDSGQTWTEITKGLPRGKWISELAASAYDEATVYMTQNGKRDDDFTPYIWKSTDYGKTWKSIASNIPGGPVNVIKEDPVNKDILYVGTDLGVYVSLDRGKYWQSLPFEIPATYIHDLVVHPRDAVLIAASHGRGMYALDVSVLQKMTGDVIKKQAHLFKIRPAKLPKWARWYWRPGISAYIHYYLDKAQTVTMVIKDPEGNTVKKLESTGDAGLNISVWDLKPERAKDAEDEGKRPRNPYVKPGIYTFELTAGGTQLTGRINVEE
jgi:photosystem II stability/assembly factor-like uncharacterized protein